MQIRTVAICSPGDMGHSVGALLKAHGLRVVTTLAGRSERTRALAARAGIEELGSLEELLRAADLLLSILVPEQAYPAAVAVAEAMRRARAPVPYVDCNAVAAATSLRMAEVLRAAGAPYVDACIIGPPPRQPGSTRFYACGPDAAVLARLGAFGLDVRVLEGGIGQASHFKTCYASLTKGLAALGTQALVAARHLHLEPALREELEASQPALLQWLRRSLPSMPPKSRRWVGEMREHAQAYAALGLSPLLMQGAAEIFGLVGGTPAGRVAPEQGDPAQTLEQMVAALAEALPLHPAPRS